MPGTSVTAANNVLMLSVTGLFNAPQQIQGFANDEAFEVENIEGVETLMGVDGIFSAGWVPVPIRQTIVLQPNSPSNSLFDTWRMAEIAAREAYIATGTLYLPAINQKLDFTQGYLTSYPPYAGAKKILQPRRYTITWGTTTVAGF